MPKKSSPKRIVRTRRVDQVDSLHELFEHFGFFPKHVESLIEYFLVLATFDKDAVQCPIKVFALA